MGSQSYAEDLRMPNLPVMALSEVEKARTFHESFPQYSVTPLVKLKPHGRKIRILVHFTSRMNPIDSDSMLLKSLADPLPWHVTSHSRQGKIVSELPYNILTSEALKKEFVRPPSLLQPMETMDAELPGLPTSSDKRQLS